MSRYPSLEEENDYVEVDLHLEKTSLEGLSELSVEDLVVERRENLEELSISFNIFLAALMTRGRFNMVGR